jgi:hypothetical protein
MHALDHPDFDQHYTPFLNDTLVMFSTKPIDNGRVKTTSSKKSKNNKLNKAAEAIVSSNASFDQMVSGILQMVSLEQTCLKVAKCKEFFELCDHISPNKIPPQFKSIIEESALQIAEETGYLTKKQGSKATSTLLANKPVSLNDKHEGKSKPEDDGFYFEMS